MNEVIAKYLEELKSPKTSITEGMKGIEVRRVQEWLTLAGYVVTCDGDFGPATAAAVRKFKRFTPGNNEPNNDPTAEVDKATWDTLVLPLMRATTITNDGKHTLGEAICAVARKYLNERAREVGGDNRGPWQRHVARGRENQPWCQDAASTWWNEAALSLGIVSLPFDLIYSGMPSSYVPWVADSARKSGMLMFDSDPRPVPIGSMFFLKSSNPQVPYSHVGIVTRDDGNVIETIEGNTNSGGSTNGYEVAARHRPRASCHYGLVSPLK